MASDDFYSRALSSLTNQIAQPTTNQPSPNESSPAHQPPFDPRAYAKSLVELDLPKIDSAVKSHLSLVAARSATVSDADLIEVSIGEDGSDARREERAKCAFVSSKGAGEANRSSLACARTVLLGVNSTILPDLNRDGVGNVNGNNFNDEAKMQHDAIRILWNGLINGSAVASQDEKKLLKPSKLLGRQALIVAYPFVKERFRRGLKDAEEPTHSEDGEACTESQSTSALRSIPNELLPPIPPPANIDPTQWEAYYTEFGNLLTQACEGSNEKQLNGYAEDDSALLWSKDGGVHELELRRERRSKRKEDALAEERKRRGDSG